MEDNREYHECMQLTSQFKFCPMAFRMDMYRGCDFGCRYCLSGDTYISMYDGTFKQLKDIKVGDVLYGVTFINDHHKMTKSTVKNVWTVEKKAYEITLANGVKLVCSGDHRWLTNRGWKYTVGSMCGENQRPYITTNNRMVGFDNLSFDTMEETDDFKLGYLSGIIRGDANLGCYDYSGSRRNTDIQYRFRLAVKCVSATRRVADYLKYFGVEVDWFDFDMVDRQTGERIKVPSIRTSKQSAYKKINELIEYKGSNEFLCGFVSGIYDAEGSNSPCCIRIANSDYDIINTLIKGLSTFGFNFTFDVDKNMPSGKVLKTVRLIGNMSDRVRFTSVFNTVLKPCLEGLSVRQCETLKIKSIKELGKMQLYDITTSTENFFANGVVSHNCFANMNAFHEIGTGLSTWREADINKVRNMFKTALETDKESMSVIVELLRHRVPIHCGGMSDPFQKREWKMGLTKELIKISKEYNYPILFSTKTASLPKEYYDLLNPKIHAFQVSILGWTPEYVKKWECATATSQERAEFVQLLRRDFGLWCSVRIQPIISKWEVVALMLALRDIPSYYSLEHLHVIADSWAGQEALLKYCKGSKSFVQNGGVTEFRTDVKQENIKFLIKIANHFGVKVGAADNDLHRMSQSRCCCGTDTIGGEFDNYLKFNECYMSTGETNVGELFIPQSNVRRHMNMGKGRPTVFVEDVVKQYIKENINLIPLEYRADVEKQLFGVTRKKLF